VRGKEKVLQTPVSKGWKCGISYGNGRRKWIREVSVGIRDCGNLPTLKNTHSLSAFWSVVNMWAVGLL
jgi:hypothetical protein